MEKRKSGLVWRFWFYFFGIVCFVASGIHYYLVQKSWLQPRQGDNFLFWLLLVGGLFILIPALYGFFSRSKDGNSHWRRKLFLLGLLFFVAGIAIWSTGQSLDEVVVGLVGFGGLFIAISRMRSGKGMGFDSVTGRRIPPTIAGHVKVDPKSVFAPTEGEEDPDSGPARMRGDR